MTATVTPEVLDRLIDLDADPPGCEIGVRHADGTGDRCPEPAAWVLAFTCEACGGRDQMLTCSGCHDYLVERALPPGDTDPTWRPL